MAHSIPIHSLPADIRKEYHDDEIKLVFETPRRRKIIVRMTNRAEETWIKQELKTGSITEERWVRADETK